MELKINNAQIVQTNLRPEQGKIIGVLAITLIINDQQANGVLSLDINAEYLESVLAVIGVGTWEQITNSYVRVKVNEENQICGIGNIMQDRWLDVNSEHPKTEE